MIKQNKIDLDFEIDELKNLLRNVISGDIFQTDITRIKILDFKAITKKKGWLFDWKLELQYPERDVYKLTIVNNQSIIQGSSLTKDEEKKLSEFIQLSKLKNMKTASEKKLTF